MAHIREAVRASIAKQTRSARRLPRRLSHAAEVAAQLVYWTLTLQLRAGLRRRRDARLIRRSGLFDVEHYLAQCPGDREAARDPIQHYLRVGAARGLSPSPLLAASAHAAHDAEAMARGENPLARLLRSRGAGPGARSRPPLTGAGRGDDLGPAARDGSPARSVLVVHARLPRSRSDERVLGMMSSLRDLGHPVTLLSASEDAGTEGEAGTAAPGLTLVRGREAGLAHLAAEGRSYQAVLLTDREEASRWLAPVRAHAPLATVIYDAAGVLGRRRSAELLGNGAPGSRAALDPVEQVNLGCADVALVRTARDRAALLPFARGGRVEIVPDIPAGAVREGDRADDPFLPLAKARLALAIEARPCEAPDPAERHDVPAREPERAEPAVTGGAAPRAGTSGSRSVLAVGVYLADRENNAVAIARELASARGWQVEQRWIALGRSPPPAQLAPLTALHERSPIPKFVLLNRLLRRLGVDRHAFVLVCDDDIALPERFVDRYLEAVTRYDLALAQPARTHGSHTDNWIVERLDGLVARRTRFVEIGPLFSMRADAVPLLTPFDEASPMGWGYDFEWPLAIERAGLRMGIVDATPVAHAMRKSFALYDERRSSATMEAYLEARPHLPRDEAFTIVEAYP